MIGFEVAVDGETLCTAGVSDAGSLHLALRRPCRGSGRPIRLHLHVGGVEVVSTRGKGDDGSAIGEPSHPHGDPEVLEWLNIDDLEVQRALEVRVIDTEAIDEPTMRRPAEPADGACVYCGREGGKDSSAPAATGASVFIFHARGNICGECVERFADEIRHLREGAT